MYIYIYIYKGSSPSSSGASGRPGATSPRTRGTRASRRCTAPRARRGTPRPRRARRIYIYIYILYIYIYIDILIHSYIDSWPSPPQYMIISVKLQAPATREVVEKFSNGTQGLRVREVEEVRVIYKGKEVGRQEALILLTLV